MDWETLYRDLKALNWMILLIIASASYFLMRPDFTTGVIFGGLMIMLNFHTLQHTSRSAFSTDSRGSVKKAPLIAKYYFRLFALAVLIYICISQQWIHPVGLAIGLSIVVISIATLGILLIRRTFSEETM